MQCGVLKYAQTMKPAKNDWSDYTFYSWLMIHPVVIVQVPFLLNSDTIGLLAFVFLVCIIKVIYMHSSVNVS